MSHPIATTEGLPMDWRDRSISDPDVLLGGLSAYYTRRYPGRSRLCGGDVARRTVHRQI